MSREDALNVLRTHAPQSPRGAYAVMPWLAAVICVPWLISTCLDLARGQGLAWQASDVIAILWFGIAAYYLWFRHRVRTAPSAVTELVEMTATGPASERLRTYVSESRDSWRWRWLDGNAPLIPEGQRFWATPPERNDLVVAVVEDRLRGPVVLVSDRRATVRRVPGPDHDRT